MDITQMHLAFRLQLDKSGKLELPAFEPEEIDFWLNTAISRFVKTRFFGSDKNLSFEEHLKRTEDLKTLVVEDDISTNAGVNKPNSFSADLSSFTDKWFTISEEVSIVYTKLGDTSPSSPKRQGVTQCTADNYNSHIEDPYSEHRLHYEEAKPLRLVYQNTVELVTDGNYTIPLYIIRYLKKPKRVNILTNSYTPSTSNIEEGITYVVSGANATYNGIVYHFATADTFIGVIDKRTFTGSGATVTAVKANCDLPEHTHDEIVGIATDMVLENTEQPRYQTHQNELNKIE